MDSRASRLKKTDYIRVPREPTPEMLAATLPMASAALGMNSKDWELVERALAMIEPATISNSDHMLGVQAGIEILRDWRAMTAAALQAERSEGGST